MFNSSFMYVTLVSFLTNCVVLCRAFQGKEEVKVRWKPCSSLKPKQKKTKTSSLLLTAYIPTFSIVQCCCNSLHMIISSFRRLTAITFSKTSIIGLQKFKLINNRRENEEAVYNVSRTLLPTVAQLLSICSNRIHLRYFKIKKITFCQGQIQSG